MKKMALTLATTSILAISASTQAAVDVCVFDLLGKSGEAYKGMQDWALAAKGWGADINLVALTDEQVADNNFKAGKCDAVAMTSMRARPFSQTAALDLKERQGGALHPDHASGMGLRHPVPVLRQPHRRPAERPSPAGSVL